MLTYWMQWVIAAASLAFAAASLLIARQARRADPYHRSAWAMAGAAFLLHGVCQVAQYTWGGLAIWSGADSSLMTSYLRVAAAFNHSRTFLLLAFCISLVVFAFRPRPPGARFGWVYAGSIVAAAAAGAAFGYAEGSLVVRRHFLTVAGLDTVELLVLLVALLAVLMADRADRLWWGALATYAFSVALSILWFTVLSRFGLPGEWMPAPAQMAAYRAFAMVVTFGFAWKRLQAERRGVVVAGLSPASRPFRPASL